MGNGRNLKGQAAPSPSEQLPVLLAHLHYLSPRKDHLHSESKSSLPLGNIFLFSMHTRHVPAWGSLYLLFPLLKKTLAQISTWLVPSHGKRWPVERSLITSGLVFLTSWGLISHWRVISMSEQEGNTTIDGPHTCLIIKLPEKLEVCWFFHQQGFTGSTSMNLVQWIQKV